MIIRKIGNQLKTTGNIICEPAYSAPIRLRLPSDIICRRIESTRVHWKNKISQIASSVSRAKEQQVNKLHFPQADVIMKDPKSLLFITCIV